LCEQCERAGIAAENLEKRTTWKGEAAMASYSQLVAADRVERFSATPAFRDPLFAVLFVVQILAGLGRIASGTGPWIVLRRPRPVTTVVPDAKSE
jgi:hypothetical protein